MRQILCFGDSNTYGLIPGTEDRYPWGMRWTSRLEEMVNPSQYRIVEEGLCGRTTDFSDLSRAGRKATDSFSMILESHQPLDTVILMLGTNDCKKAYDASEYQIGKGLEKLLIKIRNHSDKTKVLIVSPIELGLEVEEKDPEFDRESVKTSRRLKHVYRKLAEKYGFKFLAASDYAKASGKDQQHLDENGHRILASAIYKKILAKQIL